MESLNLQIVSRVKEVFGQRNSNCDIESVRSFLAQELLEASPLVVEFTIDQMFRHLGQFYTEKALRAELKELRKIQKAS